MRAAVFVPVLVIAAVAGVAHGQMIAPLGHMAADRPSAAVIAGTSAHPALRAAATNSASDNQVLRWTVSAALAPYDIDFHNYPAQLRTASRSFTRDAWNDFAATSVDHTKLDGIRSARLLCHAQLRTAPAVLDAGRARGAAFYRVKVPILEICETLNERWTTVRTMTALVVRTTDPDHPDGLVLDQLVASNQP